MIEQQYFISSERKTFSKEKSAYRKFFDNFIENKDHNREELTGKLLYTGRRTEDIQTATDALVLAGLYGCYWINFLIFKGQK